METSASEKSTSAKVPDIFCKTKSCSENCQFNHFVHYHCTVTECDFVTNKADSRLEKHYKKHKGKKSIAVQAKEAYFKSYTDNCGKNCEHRALNTSHIHCNLCSWGCSRCDLRLVRHLLNTHNITFREQVQEKSEGAVQVQYVTNCPASQQSSPECSSNVYQQSDIEINEATLHDQQSVGDVVNVVIIVKRRNISGDNTGDNKVVATVVSSVDSPLQHQRRDHDESNCLGEYDVRKTLFTADNIQSFPDEIIEEDLDFSPLVDTADLSLSSPFEPNICSTIALHKYVNDSSNSNNCVVCSESDPEKLRPCRVLKEKRK